MEIKTKIRYINISKDNYNFFHDFLVDYYRDGEESDDYSVIPGHGIILEIVLAKDYRNKGSGK